MATDCLSPVLHNEPSPGEDVADLAMFLDIALAAVSLLVPPARFDALAGWEAIVQRTELFFDYARLVSSKIIGYSCVEHKRRRNASK